MPGPVAPHWPRGTRGIALNVEQLAQRSSAQVLSRSRVNPPGLAATTRSNASARGRFVSTSRAGPWRMRATGSSEPERRAGNRGTAVGAGRRGRRCFSRPGPSPPLAAEPASPRRREFGRGGQTSALVVRRMVANRVRTDRPSIQSNGYGEPARPRCRNRRAAADRIGGEPILDDPGLLSAQAPIWSGDGRWIYYRALRSGAVQIWRSAADGSGSQAVTAEDGDILSIERALDGSGIVYRVGAPRRWSSGRNWRNMISVSSSTSMSSWDRTCFAAPWSMVVGQASA